MPPDELHSPEQNPFASPADVAQATALGDVFGDDPATRDLASFVGPRAKYYLTHWARQQQTQDRRAGFNWAACLLSGLWLPYRKMYKITAIFYAVIIVETFLEDLVFEVVFKRSVPQGIGNAFGIAVAVICGMMGNVWYLSHAKRQIAAVGDDVQGETRASILARRGGTSLGAAILAFVMFLGVMVLYGVVEALISGPVAVGGPAFIQE
ncbi:MAG: DUF2628 domain-containing protein [Planctomycetia bacterium]|nr:DUF2628 domain-containing protein [Planctomycetia bacterium]